MTNLFHYIININNEGLIKHSLARLQLYNALIEASYVIYDKNGLPHVITDMTKKLTHVMDTYHFTTNETIETRKTIPLWMEIHSKYYNNNDK